jgi:hypothetical protein
MCGTGSQKYSVGQPLEPRPQVLPPPPVELLRHFLGQLSPHATHATPTPGPPARNYQGTALPLNTEAGRAQPPAVPGRSPALPLQGPPLGPRPQVC